ncbi:MAG: DUF3322 domain-containing protein [Pseudohongiellaceae bacterium]
MKWTRPEDLRQQVQRLWDRGELLRYHTSGEPAFPLRLTLKRPASTEIADHFGDVREWIATLQKLSDLRLEMRGVRHRILGQNTLPDSIWIDSHSQAVSFISKSRESLRFQKLVDATRQQDPALVDWLTRYPLKALALADKWDKLLLVVSWIKAHPRPGIYLRQVDIPGIDSKFIESHRGVLSELLDIVLPSQSIDPIFTGIGSFSARYGFKRKPSHIRFRMLDSRHSILGGTREDVWLDIDNFLALEPDIRRFFITENEINFLSFPQHPDSTILFGAGYGWESLARAQWLQNCEIFYWGDIDTHGFAILDGLRKHFPHTQSLLMDKATLLAHRALWGVEPSQTTRDLIRLTQTESDLYDELRTNTLQDSIRLEQELVGFDWVEDAVAALARQ